MLIDRDRQTCDCARLRILFCRRSSIKYSTAPFVTKHNDNAHNDKSNRDIWNISPLKERCCVPRVIFYLSRRFHGARAVVNGNAKRANKMSTPSPTFCRVEMSRKELRVRNISTFYKCTTPFGRRWKYVAKRTKACTGSFAKRSLLKCMK